MADMSEEEQLEAAIRASMADTEGGGGGGGGGYIEGGGSTPVFTNCTITLNSPGGTLRIFSGSPQFTNSIIRGQIVNSGLGFYSHCITAGIVTSCTNCPGTNGNVDPLFTDAFNGDFST